MSLVYIYSIGDRGQIPFRLNLTKSSSEMDRMKIMHEYIFGDVLGLLCDGTH